VGQPSSTTESGHRKHWQGGDALFFSATNTPAKNAGRQNALLTLTTFFFFQSIPIFGLIFQMA